MISKNLLAARMANFEETYKTKKLPLTHQKRQLYQSLAKRCDHPDAQTLHQSLQTSLPNLSLATVYSNLKQFVTLGLAQKIKSSDTSIHYDADISMHAHVVEKGDIQDLPIQTNLLSPLTLKDKKIKKIELTYYL